MAVTRKAPVVRTRQQTREDRAAIEQIADAVVVSVPIKRSILLQLAQMAWSMAKRQLADARLIIRDLTAKLHAADDYVKKLERENRLLKAGSSNSSDIFNFSERSHMDTLEKYGLSVQEVAAHFATTPEIVKAVLDDVRTSNIRLATQRTGKTRTRAITLDG